MKTKKLSNDFTLKAGTLVRSRHFDGSIVDNRFEIIMNESYTQYPLFKENL